MRVTVSARAKINLALNITGLRDDGYHLLETVMQSVSLCDAVTVSDGAPGGRIELSVPKGLPAGAENIAHKAAQRFFEETGAWNPGVRIRIRKRIPVSAGLGGGSADAAAVILALDRLLGTELAPGGLLHIGEAIGADVPFCMTGGTMLAEGTGSILTPLPELPDCRIVLAKPGQKPSTARMYALYDQSGRKSAADIRALADAVCAGELSGVARNLGNAFLEFWNDEKTLAAIRTLTEYGALGASLSGSGPSVFGIFEDKQDAEKCAAALRGACGEVYVCRPQNAGCEWA